MEQRQRLGAWSFQSRRAHPLTWFVFDATLDVILTATLWWAFGRTVALVFGCFMGLLLLIGLVLRLFVRHLTARSQP